MVRSMQTTAAMVFLVGMVLQSNLFADDSLASKKFSDEYGKDELSSSVKLTNSWDTSAQDNAEILISETTEINRPKQIGTYYEAVVPDTLDLAQRARMGLNHFTSIICPQHNYEMYWGGAFGYNNHTGEFISPANLNLWWSSLQACQAKCTEAMAMERLMSGSTQGLSVEAKMLEMLASYIGENGLYWVPVSPEKTWLSTMKDIKHANVHGQARMLRAMIRWYQYTGNPQWKTLIDRMVNGIDKLLVVHKDNYAYIPAHGWIEDNEYFRSCYTEKGWKDTSEPENEKAGEEGSLFNHQGHFAGPLAMWYKLTGNEQALRLSGEMVRFVTKPKFWADFGGRFSGAMGADHARWSGHFHGYLNTLRVILDYAVVTDDSRLKQFVRDGYEWARQHWLARIGFVGDGQGCGMGRFIGLAVKLGKNGIGDYWEDIDLSIRNHALEYQFTERDMLHYWSKAEKQPLKDGQLTEAMQASIGAVSGDPFKTGWGLCCTSHGNMAFFYAWDAILDDAGDLVKVNLLLNRASPMLDIASYLPFEGKVVLKNKKAKEVLVRIPLWVDKTKITSAKGNHLLKHQWLGSYLRLGSLQPDDEIRIEFPVEQRTETWTTPGKVRGEWAGWDETIARTITFKGNTVIEMSHPILPHSPLYAYREDYQADKAPMKKVKRYVTEQILQW